MRFAELAQNAIAAVSQMTPAQRAAMTQCMSAINLGIPENAELWEAVKGQFTEPAGKYPIELLRAALDELPLESWRAMNALGFVLRRGNIYDETFDVLPGGGIRFHFAARYERFLAWVEEEAARIRNVTGREEISVLDVGCWQGTLVCELLQRGFRAMGTDLCAEVTDTVQDRVALLKPEHQKGFLGAVSGWAHSTVPALDRFDIVTCQETLEHVPTRVLGQTADALLGAARHAVLVTVPGWDDIWALHLRVFTLEGLVGIFDPTKRAECDTLEQPGGGAYTAIRVRPKWSE